MRKIGYARVSAQHQNLDRQLGALVAEGCERISKEKASSRSTMGRPGLERAIVALTPATGRAATARCPFRSETVTGRPGRGRSLPRAEWVH
jgi:hypothetical protein